VTPESGGGKAGAVCKICPDGQVSVQNALADVETINRIQKKTDLIISGCLLLVILILIAF
jgi:hypothetical protein